MYTLRFENVKCCGNCKFLHVEEGSFITTECTRRFGELVDEKDYCKDWQSDGVRNILFEDGLRLGGSCAVCKHSKHRNLETPLIECFDKEGWLCMRDTENVTQCYPVSVCDNFQKDGKKVKKLERIFDMASVKSYGVEKAKFCGRCKYVREVQHDDSLSYVCMKHSENTTVDKLDVCDSFERKEEPEEKKEVKAVERKCINCKFVSGNIVCGDGTIIYRCFAEKEPPEVKPDDCCSNFIPKENK